jgi:hypothetical protein
VREGQQNHTLAQVCISQADAAREARFLVRDVSSGGALGQGLIIEREELLKPLAA